MKKKQLLSSLLFTSLALFIPANTLVAKNVCDTIALKHDSLTVGNPILPGFHADPEILYSNKTGKYYIYSTTDGIPGWGGYKYYVYSSADLKTWKNEGVALDASTDQISWANGNLWAPAAVEVKQKNGSYKYYLYFSARPNDNGRKQMGVCLLYTSRHQIDDLDNQLMELLSKRMRVCREIGQYKKEHNMTVLQSARYNEILEKRGAQGTLCGMDADFVAHVYELIHGESVRQQIEIVNKN